MCAAAMAAAARQPARGGESIMWLAPEIETKHMAGESAASAWRQRYGINGNNGGVMQCWRCGGINGVSTM